MNMKIVLDVGAKMPTYAHKDTDAGADLYCKEYEDFVIEPNGCAVVDTGVHIEIPHGWFGDVRSKSGRYFKQNLICTGTIDEGYTGSIKVKLTNLDSDVPAYIGKGEKVAQIVFSRCEQAEFERVKKLEETERGTHGFGSSGAK